ncbi:hypothetical protein R5R35_014175 [Gryllus longicercus]|uniref:Ataxin-10 n=1 Tax=Gryllus longicercus TaxID=2509291 RepID=A0AAN9Z961_9ORTH
MSLDSPNVVELPAIFTTNVENHDWNKVTLNVKEAMKKLRPKNGNVSTKILKQVAHALDIQLSVLRDEQSAEVIGAITECFRFLRNACAVDRHLQKCLVNSTIFTSTSDLLGILCSDTTLENNLSCVKIIVQFIGNAIVGNQKNQIIAWEIFHPHVKKLLVSVDDSLVNFSCMVLYNILIGELDATLQYITTNMPLLLNCYSNGSEFAMFIVEYVLGIDKLLEEIYPQLNSEYRLELLDAIWSLLVEREKETEENVKFPVSNVLFLVKQLKQQIDSVLTIVEEGMTAEPRETLRLLDVVACASSRTQYLPSLQADRSLLISIACLLKNVTEIGKSEGGNIFSSVQRLSEVKLSNESVQSHPVFGFKVSLVRLVGNLCHQQAENQNQVRELGCLPAVLDACNIDVYNPLLLQWGVFAVRNLLENNLANQGIVAELVAKGPASSAVLHELGMELHQDEGGSIRIAPLKRS